MYQKSENEVAKRTKKNFYPKESNYYKKTKINLIRNDDEDK
jgi:hypothetical protein